MMVSFVLSFFPRDVLDEILNLIESVSEDFPSYFYKLVEAPSNFIAGRPKAALLFWFLMVVLLSVCLLSASIVATCIAAHFALCRAL